MHQTWQSIEAWLRKNFPDGLENLGQPAQGCEIEDLEKSIGSPLPHELKELLCIHNGEQPNEIWLFGNWSLLPVKYIDKAWHKEIVQAAQLDCGLVPDEYVKPCIWNCKWYPFAYDGSGGYLCVDMDPSSAGSAGQVILTNTDGFCRRVAKSVSLFLDKFRIALHDGKLTVVDEHLEHNTEWWS
jgi:cell wall assembly regulator SMI1